MSLDITTTKIQLHINILLLFIKQIIDFNQSKIDVKFCSSCLKDEKSTFDVAEWIQSDRCTVWLHLYCTQPQLTTIPAD